MALILGIHILFAKQTLTPQNFSCDLRFWWVVVRGGSEKCCAFQLSTYIISLIHLLVWIGLSYYELVYLLAYWYSGFL